MLFTKTPKSYDEQVALFRHRGLHIENESKARHHLCNVSYYRLSAYFVPFQHRNDPDHAYKDGATFNKVFQLYLFDREMRLLAMDAIERIEVAIRCKIVYEFCTRHGNLWFNDPSLYLSHSAHQKVMHKINEELARSSENFIVHYNNKYGDPVLPPAWMTLEILSFGQLSFMYKNLKANDAKKAVGEYFGLSYTILISWMEHIAYVRNLCAHHSRLWNRTLTVRPTIPRNSKIQWINTALIRQDKPYISFAIMAYFIKIITPGHYFTGKLRSLFTRFEGLDTLASGFYKGWENDSFWLSMKIPVTYRARIIFFQGKHFAYRTFVYWGLKRAHAE